MLKNLFFKLTGGRPMKYVASMFIDVVSGEPVNRYEDRLGRSWMASSPWAPFRVRIEK